MKRLVPILFLALPGCVVIPELEPAAESVMVVTTDARVEGCQSLGLVHGYSDNGLKGYGGLGGISQQHSVYDARNKAHRLGANTLFIVSTNSRTGGTDTTGEAFRCPPSTEDK